MIPTTKNDRRAGIGLLEMLIGIAILSVFLGSLALSSSSMLRMGVATDVRAKAQETGATTLFEILRDLRFCGNVAPYPYLFVDGLAEDPFASHAHAPATENAAPGEDGFGPNREIVLVQPADDDGNGVPDFDLDGDLLWSADEVSYVLVTGVDGINVLERRVNGVRDHVVARYVERVTFDDISSSGFEVPLGAIRVRIWFRFPDRNGGILQHQVEATVGLRN